MVKGSDSKSDEHLLAGVQIPPISFFFVDWSALVAEWSKALATFRS